MTPAPRSSSRPLLSVVAGVSGVYDVALGLAMMCGRPVLTRLFELPPPVPPIHADLNGLFLVAVGLGYLLPWQRPDTYRGYLWVMGPGLKGGGALLLVADHLLRHSPASFLLFAVSDGTLALLTLWALLRRPAERSSCREA